MSEVAARDWTSRTEDNHSDYCPRKHHTSDCSPIVVFIEPRAIKAGEDCPTVRSVTRDSGQGAQLTGVDCTIEVSELNTECGY